MIYQKEIDLKFATVKDYNFSFFDSLKVHRMPLEDQHFYCPKREVTFHSHMQQLECEVEKNNHKMVYLSYGTLNNQFDKEPEESIIPVVKGTSYYVRIGVEKDATLQIIPIIVEYSAGKKTKLNKVTEPDELISFEESTDKCRLTFKLIGFGHATISDISFFEYREGGGSY